MARRFSDWILIILIILFFAIPVCGLALNEPVTSWPRSTASLVYNYFLK
jgi:hypothetical protein